MATARFHGLGLGLAWFTRAIQDDRVMYGYLAIHTVGWLWGLRFLLRKWRDEAEIKPPQPKTQYITQETEDALKLDTLDTMLTHYNHAIRETASKIVCDRAVNDRDTVDRLLWGITRPDYDERMENLRALAIITDPQSLEALHHWKAYAALVRSLELCLDPEQEVLGQDDWDEFPLRDMAEKLCLIFISQLLNNYGPQKLLKAKFVEKWLAKQNWGADLHARRRNITHYYRTRRNRITDIIASIRSIDIGLEALEMAGLQEPESPPESHIELEIATGAGGPPMIERFSVLLPSNVDVNGLREDEQARVLLRSLQSSQSVEEQRVRHRHREAIVLNDGTRPLNSDDIIQRPESPTSG